VKARRGRTNNRSADAQLAKIDIRESRLRRMAQELYAHGIDVPDYNHKSKDTLIQAGPEVHHWMAQDSDRRIAWYLAELKYRYPADPAIEVCSQCPFYPYTVLINLVLYASPA
jgi:hypothetical protein